jgi:hypothetical protein
MNNNTNPGRRGRLFGMFSVLSMLGAVLIDPAEAAQPPYLDEMPSPERVLAEVRGRDDLDTAARQAGTFHQLVQMMRVMSEGRAYRNQLTPDEQRVMKSYHDAEGRIIAPMPNRFDAEETRRLGMNSPRAKWFGQYTRYGLDTQFVLGKFFSPAWQANYRAVMQRDQRQTAAHELQQGQPPSRASLELLFHDLLARFGIGGTEFLLFGVGLPLGLLALGVAREMRRFGLDERDPFTLNAGWTTYALNTTTGTVLSPTKSREVQTHVSGGGPAYVSHGVVYSQPITSTTTTTIHDQFFIHDPGQNRERAFKLQNVDIALREGHAMSVAWGIKKGKNSGYNFLFRNHTTRRTDFIDGAIRGMIRPHAWLVLPVTVLAPSAWGLWLRSGVSPSRSYEDLGVSLMVAVVATFAGFFIVRAIITRIRAARLKREISERLLPVLDQRAVAAGGA